MNKFIPYLGPKQPTADDIQGVLPGLPGEGECIVGLRGILGQKSYATRIEVKLLAL